MYNVHVLLKIFHDEICWTFLDRNTVTETFFRDQICFDTDTEPFPLAKLSDTDTDTLKNIWKGLENLTSH